MALEGERIAQVTPASTAPVPDGATVIDAAGRR
jgi:hypothetical protein